MIALTSDFGLEDVYVGVMKGVILSICPDVRIVDVTHGIPPQDILAGCLALQASRPYFPPSTIHVAVVDPGVGSDRAALAVRTMGEVFVAPDNGLLSFLADDEILECRRIENPNIRLRPVSRTFHGRDVFAPAAAHLAAGLSFERVGPPAPALERIEIPQASPTPEGIQGEVITFDRFGNAVTSIRESDLPTRPARALVKGGWVPVVDTYSAVAPGSAMCLLGSSGRIEVSIREGDARKVMGLARRDPILVAP